MSRHFLAVSALAALFALTPAAPVQAQDAPPAAGEPTEEQKKEASERFRKGVELYKNGDYRAALIEFKRAYEVAPNYRVLFNLGQTSFELREYVEALKSFEAYLEQGGDEISADRREKVEGELVKLRQYVARVTITVNVPGAEVAVDDVVIGVSPMAEPVLVSAGRRKVTMRKEGYAPLQRMVDVAGGESRELALELTSLTTAPPPPAPAPKPPEDTADDGETNVGFWVSLSITLGLGIGTGVMGGLALSAQSSYDDELNTFPNTQDNIDDAASSVRTFAAATDVLAALTAGAGITTIIFAATGFSSGDDGSDSAVKVDVAPGGVVVSGVF